MSSARYVKQVSRPYTKGLSEQGVRSELFSAPITGKKAGKKTVTASDQGITGKLHHSGPSGAGLRPQTARPVLHFDKKRWKSAAS